MCIRDSRYLELDIETRGEPLTVEDLRATYVGFPFARRAQFDVGAPDVNLILDVGWRTARLCAHETYMAVSYTHLDVYKRQDLNRRASSYSRRR